MAPYKKAELWMKKMSYGSKVQRFSSTQKNVEGVAKH